MQREMARLDSFSLSESAAVWEDFAVLCCCCEVEAEKKALAGKGAGSSVR